MSPVRPLRECLSTAVDALRLIADTFQIAGMRPLSVGWGLRPAAVEALAPGAAGGASSAATAKHSTAHLKA